MEGFARSKDVHRTLAKLWDTWCKANGFKRIRSGKCGYFRPQGGPEYFLAFEVQCSSWSQDWSGGEFTLNGAGCTADPKHLNHRFLRFLDDTDLSLAKQIQAGISARIPDIPVDHPIQKMILQTDQSGQQLLDMVSKRREPLSFKWDTGNDHWCNYFSVDDIAEWGEYLLERLPRLLTELAANPNVD